MAIATYSGTVALAAIGLLIGERVAFTFSVFLRFQYLIKNKTEFYFE